MAITDLRADDLRRLLREEPDRVELIDVRTPAEHAAVRIRGSRLIPLAELPGRLPEIDWDKRVVFVCRSGARSRLVAEVAAASGRQVANLRFGILECYGDGGGEFLEGTVGGTERHF